MRYTYVSCVQTRVFQIIETKAPIRRRKLILQRVRLSGRRSALKERENYYLNIDGSLERITRRECYILLTLPRLIIVL